MLSSVWDEIYYRSDVFRIADNVHIKTKVGKNRNFKISCLYSVTFVTVYSCFLSGINF